MLLKSQSQLQMAMVVTNGGSCLTVGSSNSTVMSGDGSISDNSTSTTVTVNKAKALSPVVAAWNRIKSRKRVRFQTQHNRYYAAPEHEYDEELVKQCWHSPEDYKYLKKKTMRRVKQPHRDAAEGKPVSEAHITYDRLIKQAYTLARQTHQPADDDEDENDYMSMQALYENDEALVHAMASAEPRIGLERWTYCADRFAIRRVVQDTVIDLQDLHDMQARLTFEEGQRVIAREAQLMSWPCRLFATVIAQALAQVVRNEQDDGELDEEASFDLLSVQASSCDEEEDSSALSGFALIQNVADDDDADGAGADEELLDSCATIVSVGRSKGSMVVPSAAKKLWKKMKSKNRSSSRIRRSHF